tara:strand:- start:411 stop:866 length:456 start_codon:yes stop_codon:yes gene_type:complete
MIKKLTKINNYLCNTFRTFCPRVFIVLLVVKVPVLAGILAPNIMEDIEYWQIDKIESMLKLCPYDEDYKDYILNNLPETKEEANELLGQLWFDHIPRDPRDQFTKMLSMNTLVKTDYKYYYICKDCGEDFYSKNKESLCTECLSSNIIEKK